MEGGGFFIVKGLSSLIEANCNGAVQEMALPAPWTLRGGITAGLLQQTAKLTED